MLLNTEPGFRTKNIMNVNLVYESKDFSSYTYESMQQRLSLIHIYMCIRDSSLYHTGRFILPLTDIDDNTCHNHQRK